MGFDIPGDIHDRGRRDGRRADSWHRARAEMSHRDEGNSGREERSSPKTKFNGAVYKINPRILNTHLVCFSRHGSNLFMIAHARVLFMIERGCYASYFFSPSPHADRDT